MFIYWITLPIAFIAITVLIVTVLRHWKEIRLLDPSSIKEEQERQKRDDLITRRFHRVTNEGLAPIKAAGAKGVQAAKNVYRITLRKLQAMQGFYEKAKTPFATLTPSANKERVKGLIDEARSLARDQKWAEAERRYIEALSLDSRQWDAYKGLAVLYLKQRLYSQARETFEFLAKSKKADDVCFAGLADIAEIEGNMLLAEEMRRKAVEIRPRLANRQAELAEQYIKMGDASKAWPYAKRAVELDEKSSKYLEISLEVAILLRNRDEARRRYDKLRVLSDDRSKLQSFKERLDDLSKIVT